MMNRERKACLVKKVFLLTILLVAYQIPAYGLYSSWEYATSLFTRSNPELSSNNNNNNQDIKLTPHGKIHQSKKFLLACTATHAKSNGNNNVHFKTPLIEEPIDGLNYWIFGLFDGIGGDNVSEYLKKNILSKIRLQVQQDPLLSNAIQRALDDVHSKFLAENELSGSSVLLAIIDKNKKITIAHAGNSLAVLKTFDKYELLTQPHTLANEEEYNRITAPFFNEKNSIPKPYLRSYTAQAKAVIYEANAFMRSTSNDYYLYACNMIENKFLPNTSYTSKTTRGIGQIHFLPYFISRIDIQEVNPNPRHRFLILGTAGFWDVISPQAAVDIVEECIEQEMNNGKDTYEKHLNPHSIAQTLVDRAWGMIDYKPPQSFDRAQDQDLNFTHDNDIAVTIILFSANIYRYLIFS
jgi:serine/threonine protein phosphatase PrpC